MNHSDIQTDRVNGVNSLTIGKVNEFVACRRLAEDVGELQNRIGLLLQRLQTRKAQEIAKAIDASRQSTDAQQYLRAIRHDIVVDEDTDSSSDDDYSAVEAGRIDPIGQRMGRWHAWLAQRCEIHSRWSWLLSEIQSTEFRLKYLRKYADETRAAKRKYYPKIDGTSDEFSRAKFSRFDKRRRVHIHNLLSSDLIKFVSPIYSTDDNSSDKTIRCKCRLGDTGPCILCCGMKNRTIDPQQQPFHSHHSQSLSQSSADSVADANLQKAAALDSSIHVRLSYVSDIRSQIKRNVLFNGYVKTPATHWSYPRTRVSVSPIVNVPLPPKTTDSSSEKTRSIQLDFGDLDTTLPVPISSSRAGVHQRSVSAEGLATDIKKIEETTASNMSAPSDDIKLPSWRMHLSDNGNNPLSFGADSYVHDGLRYRLQRAIGMEDLRDSSFVHRHEPEEEAERWRHYPAPLLPSDGTGLVRYYHGYEYRQSLDVGYGRRSFPLLFDTSAVFSSAGGVGNHQRSRRPKRSKADLFESNKGLF